MRYILIYIEKQSVCIQNTFKVDQQETTNT